MDTPSALVEAYHRTVQAPVSEIIWFEGSAHSPFVEESQRFANVLIDRLLNEAPD